MVKQSGKCVGTFTISFGFVLYIILPFKYMVEIVSNSMLPAKSQVTSNLCPFGCVGDGAYGFSLKMCKLSVN